MDGQSLYQRAQLPEGGSVMGVGELARLRLAGRSDREIAAEIDRRRDIELGGPMGSALSARVTRRSTVATDAYATEKTCAKCGAANDDDAKHCDQCGAEFADDDDDEEAAARANGLAIAKWLAHGGPMPEAASAVVRAATTTSKGAR